MFNSHIHNIRRFRFASQSPSVAATEQQKYLWGSIVIGHIPSRNLILTTT